MDPRDRWIAWAQSIVGQPFEWGRTDCWTLTVQAIDLALGTKLARRYRGRWRNEAEARAYAEACGETAADVLREVGAREIPPAFAARGDILERKQDGLPCVAPVVGRLALVSAPGHAVMLLPLTRLDLEGWRAWRLPWAS